MGGRNARLLLAQQSKLSHRHMRLLMLMAVVSIDPPGANGYPPCLYWAGPDRQTLGMGLDDTQTNRRHLRGVREDLVAAGAIIRLRPYGARRNPSWLLMTGEQPPEYLAAAWLSGTFGPWPGTT